MVSHAHLDRDLDGRLPVRHRGLPLVLVGLAQRYIGSSEASFTPADLERLLEGLGCVRDRRADAPTSRGSRRGRQLDVLVAELGDKRGSSSKGSGGA